MTVDGGLDRWYVDGPVIWHSETSGLDYWHIDGVWSDYESGSSASPSIVSILNAYRMRRTS